LDFREITLDRQPGIEIYLRDCPLERLAEWLRTAVGPLEEAIPMGDAVVYPSTIGPVVVTPDVGESLVSVWFNTPRSPWNTDAECARQAADELKCTVRCDPGPHFAEVPPAPTIFLEISGGNERLTEWE
jgi:hypothetical protein